MRILIAAALGAGLAWAGNANASVDITPSFAGAPSGWTPDRQAPAGFSDVGNFQGHGNVLGISVGTDPTAASFYNTQGEGTPIAGGAGSSISALLYVPAAWGAPGAAAVRTDMWGQLNTSVVNPAEGNMTTFAILGYTNYGSLSSASSNYALNAGDAYTGFRFFDDNADGAGNGQWVNLPGATVNYDAWNELTIDFTGSEFDYYINGILAGSDTNTDSATGFSRLIMQGYEFYNVGTQTTAYTADWANVPEPASMAVLGVGMTGLGIIRRRRSARQAG